MKKATKIGASSNKPCRRGFLLPRNNDDIAGFDYYKNGTITRYYLLRDATKLVIALLKEDGTIVEQYDYDPFGNILNDLTNISKINSILYKGYYFDFESGYYYCNSRYYNPKWCRWMSPDAIDYLNPEVLKGLNLYAYCENDPVNKHDPSGHKPVWYNPFSWFDCVL